MSAKVCISSTACLDVQKENFWPEYVKCKPWQPEEFGKSFLKPKLNVAQNKIIQPFCNGFYTNTNCIAQ